VNSRQSTSGCNDMQLVKDGTPAEQYVALILVDMFAHPGPARRLVASEELPPVVYADRPEESDDGSGPPRATIDDVVAQLKRMCHLEPGAAAAPVDGTIPLMIGDEPCEARCHFDDDADLRCTIEMTRAAT